MARQGGWPVRLLAVVLLCGVAGGVRGASFAEDLPPDSPHALGLWITTGPERPAGPWMAILTQPAGWQSGDAAVLLVPGGDWPDGLREHLAAALLAAGAAVLELPHGAPSPLPLAQAIHALRRDASAGIIVAIGRGEGGDAALALADAQRRAAAPLAALARIGPGAPVFRFAETAPAEGWARRAALLCTLLAGLAPPDAPGLGEACQAALPN